MDVQEQVINDGLFRLEIIEWHGRQALKKSAKPSTPQTRVERLKNDVYGMEFFAKLSRKFPKLMLAAPAVFDSGDGYYIREFITDPCVLNEGVGLQAGTPRLTRYADLLADIDRIEPYGEVKFVGSSNYRKLHASITEWADENLRDGIITEPENKRVKQISAGLDKYITPRIAHGDMSPYKHAYLRADGKITLIDCENFTPQAARYFDTAWSYTRLYSFAESTDIPKYFLASFLEQADPVPHRIEQLMAVIIQRTLGMQKDAHVDLKDKGIDYRDRAKELLSLVLQDNPGKLYT